MPGPTRIVVAMVLYEVGKLLLLRQSPPLADVFVSEALCREVVAVDKDLAMAAAVISIPYLLPMADALLYATAQSRGALFTTSDGHFSDLPGVTLI